ncbi:MAG TPA: nucleotide sugar dehydrogenase [Candidatus Tumulicola sp.]
MNIVVLGLGYVGLPTAALAASAGHEVFGYDADPAMREELRRGFVRGREQDVCDLAKEMLDSGRLHVTDGVESGDAYIVCVPTPSVHDRPDLRYVNAALADVAKVVQPDQLIAIESTVPPGTTERLVRQAMRAAGKSFMPVRVVHAPERILPGAILRELRENYRIVGGRTPEDAEAGRALYASFVDARIHVTDLRTAEFVKVIENTYRDVNIALANELALFCEEIDIDVWNAISLANNHPRVNIMQPGPGVGGHCIPIDPQFLADLNPFATELIQASRRVNERMPRLIVRRVTSLVGEPDGDRKVTILGASYKANVDDTRESPSLRVRELLDELGYRTAVYDPVANPALTHHDLADALHDTDAVVLAVDHDAFRTLDPFTVGTLVRSRVLIDCRNFYDKTAWKNAGFDVYGLGRGTQTFPVPATAERQQSLS